MWRGSINSNLERSRLIMNYEKSHCAYFQIMSVCKQFHIPVPLYGALLAL
jgi:hypothetical protein